MKLLALLSLFSLVLAQEHAEQAPLDEAVQDSLEFKLHHRVFHPQASGMAFDSFGTLLLSRSPGLLSPAPSLIQSNSHASDLRAFAESLQHQADANDIQDVEEALYQVALEHPGDKDHSQWDVSSVKACHLTTSTAQSIIVHVASDRLTPFAIDYFVGPIPRDGSCPKKSKNKSIPSKQALDFKPFANTSVVIRTPTYPPLPQLNTPPPLTTEGKLVEPVPEKSFLQKYWVYIAIAGLALVFSPAPAEDEGAGNGGAPTQARR